MNFDELAREFAKLTPEEKKRLLGHAFGKEGAAARNKKLSPKEREKLARKAGRASAKRRKEAKEKKLAQMDESEEKK